MRKIIIWFGIGLLLFMIADISRAGLLDYDRLNKKRGQADGSASRGLATPVAPAVPFWAIQTPRVGSAIEKRYDINRDGLMQTSEVKIYLRDVIDVVEEKGGYIVDSDILKAYDKNKDGVINKYELSEVKADSSS